MVVKTEISIFKEKTSSIHIWSEVKSLSCVLLFSTMWIVAYQAPPSMGFSKLEYWSRLPFPSPGNLPNLGIEPRSPSLQADSLPSEPAIFCFYLYQQTSLLEIFSLFPEPSTGLRGRLNNAPKDTHLLILEPVNVLPSIGKGTLHMWLSIFILWESIWFIRCT